MFVLTNQRVDYKLNERVIIDGSEGSGVLWNGISPEDSHMNARKKIGTFGGLSESRDVEYENGVVGTGLSHDHVIFDDFQKEKDFSSLQAQLCPSSVICYAIDTHAWFRITISRITDVDWATDALNHLVLEKLQTKEILVRLVQQHKNNKDKILGDVIKSKGKVSYSCYQRSITES